MPAILFDIDGTLLDSVDLHARAWREAFLAFGKDIPLDAFRSQIGKGRRPSSSRCSSRPPSSPRPARRSSGGAVTGGRCGTCIGSRRSPGVRPLFVALRSRGWKPVLASSAKEDELSFYVRVLEVG
jgi:beta-phosphoglucomutase-like phosphatase (HAD superfamily)